MVAKKLILTIFLLIALNFSFQPGQYTFKRAKQTIEYVIEYKEDANTTNLLKLNQKLKLQSIVSLKIQIMMIDRYTSFFDTS